MSTLAQRIADLAARVAGQCKTILTLVNGNAADLSALNTTAKGNLVASLNELQANILAVINDGAVGNATTYSSNKISALINAAVAALVNSSPAALDTLKELADAIGDDPNFAATITAALGNRVRVDTATQGLTAAQQANARANIAALSIVEIGAPDTDFVATFNAALV